MSVADIRATLRTVGGVARAGMAASRRYIRRAGKSSTRTARVEQGRKPLNLALQGGGAHGAFTWGVLERLLQDGRLQVDAVSGASAGAVNAVLLAAGMVEDGAQGARLKLEAFWQSMTGALQAMVPDAVLDPLSIGAIQGWSAFATAVDVTSRFLSPYQINLLDYDPLRETVETLVDFRGPPPPIAAPPPHRRDRGFQRLLTDLRHRGDITGGRPRLRLPATHPSGYEDRHRALLGRRLLRQPAATDAGPGSRSDGHTSGPAHSPDGS